MKRAAFLIPGRDLEAAIALAREAEQLGYESLWVTHGLGRDAFLVLHAYGAVTTRIGLGSGVVPLYPRHPVAMAQAALTLNELTRGRFRLGIGVSHRATMEQMLGLHVAAPRAVTREYVAVLRGALAGAVEFEGRYYRVHWSLGLPVRPAAPPLYLAALSPGMLELAGEVADGVVLWLTPPAYVREVALPALERGRRRVGRSLDGFEVVAAVPVAVTDDPTGALATFRGELVRYLQLPFYRAMLERAGFGALLGAFDRSGETPTALVRTLGVAGGAQEGRAWVAAHREAGVTLPAIRPIGFPDAPWYRRTLEQAAAW